MAFGKPDLVSFVANEAALTKEQAQKAVEAMLNGITDTLKSGEEVRFIGFGSFVVQKSAAREGRNPRTGDTIQIAASNRPTFRAGIELKNAINGKEGSASAKKVKADDKDNKKNTAAPKPKNAAAKKK